MKSVRIRFYAELNDFIPPDKRKVEFLQEFSGRVAIKDLIESIGVPHVEIDLILVNGLSKNFTYIVEEGDRISVYPVFESFDIVEVQRLRPKPLRNNKFILDFHLLKLARYLRMLGFDSEWMSLSDNNKIIDLSTRHKRTILSKSVELLKRKDITHGYWIRNTEIKNQIKEVLSRFQLENKIDEFTRCMECNTILVDVKKESVEHRIHEKVKNYCEEFKECCTLRKVILEREPL